jgi:hypothetical protein
VSGTLAPGVELTGVLSDRDLPLGAAGATQDLKALDRVLIELKAPQGGAALGDVTLGLQRGEFARLERRLQGARGEWSGHGFTGVAAAASAQGEYHSLQFYGVDGRQGPYALTDRDGSPFISVIAGSEVVTLDGVRLTRGESADYSMDYELGRLTFTNRRPISSASRITWSISSASTVPAQSRRGRSGRGSGGQYAFTTFITESDDQGRPLGVTLDSGDRFVLGAAGDSSELAVGGGVAAGSGDYILVPAGTVPAHYAFAGVDSGTYSVRFARVGAGSVPTTIRPWCRAARLRVSSARATATTASDARCPCRLAPAVVVRRRHARRSVRGERRRRALAPRPQYIFIAG